MTELDSKTKVHSGLKVDGIPLVSTMAGLAESPGGKILLF